MTTRHHKGISGAFRTNAQLLASSPLRKPNAGQGAGELLDPLPKSKPAPILQG